MGNIFSTPSRPFRFLDLPAELRNTIYFLTLTHNRQTGSKATPALLRTCKQVYAEAIGVLNAQSTLSIKVASWGDHMIRDRLVARTEDIYYRGTKWRGARSSDFGDFSTLPPSLPKVRNIHLHFIHSPYFHDGICKNNGRSSDTYLFLKKLTIALGEDETLPRSIICTFERWSDHGSPPGPVTSESLGLQSMFEPLYDYPATTAIEVKSSAFKMPGWMVRHYLSGSEQRAAAINAAWKGIARQVQTIIDGDIMSQIASRPGMVAEVDAVDDASKRPKTS